MFILLLIFCYKIFMIHFVTICNVANESIQCSLITLTYWCHVVPAYYFSFNYIGTFVSINLSYMCVSLDKRECESFHFIVLKIVLYITYRSFTYPMDFRTTLSISKIKLAGILLRLLYFSLQC